jgi:hypothetical protein
MSGMCVPKTKSIDTCGQVEVEQNQNHTSNFKFKTKQQTKTVVEVETWRVEVGGIHAKRAFSHTQEKNGDDLRVRSIQQEYFLDG